MSGTKVSIDSAGRLVIPKAMRERAGLEAGMQLEIRFVGDRLELLPATRQIRIERRGPLLVAESEEPVGTLKSETVARTLDELRGSRGRV